MDKPTLTLSNNVERGGAITILQMRNEHQRPGPKCASWPGARVAQRVRQQKGNVTLAARTLGVSRDSLRDRMDKYELSRDDDI